jgi:hypothetical protein
VNTSKTLRVLAIAAALFAYALGVPTLAAPGPGSAAPMRDLPADFEAVMGYAPVPARLADGTLRQTKPGSGCSSPLGDEGFGFEVACEAHDLGYDLLRYAQRTGAPLQPDARRAVDAVFVHDLRTQCTAAPPADAPACDVLAGWYARAVGFNSWRERYGPPVNGDARVVWSLGLGPPLALVAAGAWRSLRRRAAAAEQPLPA